MLSNHIRHGLSALLFVFLLLGLDALARAAPESPGGGTLFFADGERATVLATDVDIVASGITARVTVKQRFRNQSQAWTEGVYVFPLPERAAVDRLRMHIGERVIEGEIREREEARRTYEQARDQGKRASLIEQERPNLFTTSVANIGPGEDIVVEIAYLQILQYDRGEFRLRFPMTLTPRYIPGSTLPEETVRVGGDGWARHTDQVPNAPRITPRMARPDDQVRNPVRISTRIDLGLTLSRLDSTYHAVDIDRRGSTYHVGLTAGAVQADRDFELVWAPALQQTPTAALFRETVADEHYALIMVLPPRPEAAARLPRETVFVIDTSGSMGGASIEQARAALALALERLEPADRFNVIQFNSGASALFPAAVPADRQHVRHALDHVARLQAGGGTEMSAALRLALAGNAAEGYIRQVVFITDGAVGNEAALFEQIRRDLGGSRLFTVGIGSAPNSHFMTRAARFGRGTHTFIGRPDEVAGKMGALFDKLEKPVATDLRIALPQGAESYPERIPDLYAGEPVIVAARLPTADGKAEIGGVLDGSTWRRTVELADGGTHPGIGALWAREKIAELKRSLAEGADAEQVREAIVAVALEHRLVSPHTSLVAVDQTPARHDQALNQEAIPNLLPAGSDPRAWPMAFAQTATPMPLHFVLALILLSLAACLAWSARPREEA